MSTLEHLPKPKADTRRILRKRSAPGPSLDQTIASSRPQLQAKHHPNLPPTAMAPPSTSPLTSTSKNASISMRMTSKPQAIDSQTDTIDRVLYNVESRMVQHSSVFETSISNAPVRRGANTNPTMTMHGYGHGKLTADEIEHLILLSAATLSAREYFSGMNGNGNAGNSSGCVDASATNENDFSWSNVDIDSITQLSGYLEEHVKSAMSINLIQEARVAFDANETMVRNLILTLH